MGGRTRDRENTGRKPPAAPVKKAPGGSKVAAPKINPKKSNWKMPKSKNDAHY
jgi:hypothetical protein